MCVTLLSMFDNKHVTLDAQVRGDRVFLNGVVNNPSAFHTMELWAAAPAVRNSSYSGSGLPYGNPDMAFENTPNYYVVPANGQINSIFALPNSYYEWDGRTKIPSAVTVVLVPKRSQAETIEVRIAISDPLPLRTLTHRPERGRGPSFYADKEEIFGVPPNQEYVLRNIEKVKKYFGVA